MPLTPDTMMMYADAAQDPEQVVGVDEGLARMAENMQAPDRQTASTGLNDVTVARTDADGCLLSLKGILLSRGLVVAVVQAGNEQADALCLLKAWC